MTGCFGSSYRAMLIQKFVFARRYKYPLSCNQAVQCNVIKIANPRKKRCISTQQTLNSTQLYFKRKIDAKLIWHVATKTFWNV